MYVPAPAKTPSKSGSKSEPILFVRNARAHYITSPYHATIKSKFGGGRENVRNIRTEEQSTLELSTTEQNVLWRQKRASTPLSYSCFLRRHFYPSLLYSEVVTKKRLRGTASPETR